MDSAVGEGAGVVISIFLQKICLVTAGFLHEKGKLLLLFRGIFCAVMSNRLQNQECNILPCTVSHVNKFDEIKGINLNRIPPYLCFNQTNNTQGLQHETKGPLPNITKDL